MTQKLKLEILIFLNSSPYFSQNPRDMSESRNIVDVVGGGDSMGREFGGGSSITGKPDSSDVGPLSIKWNSIYKDSPESIPDACERGQG